MVGIEYIVDRGYYGTETYSIEDDGGSSPRELAHRILSDLRKRYPELVIYQSGLPAGETEVERLCHGETLLVWESEEASEDDDGSHTCASIRCVRDLDDWIQEHIGSPSHAWDRWVGGQTPQEFMDCAPDQSIEEAVAEYVDDRMGYEWIIDHPEVREALVRALVAEIDGSGAVPTYLQED